MRLLFISGWLPYPPDNGTKIRIYNLLRGLAAEHEVTLLSFADKANGNSDIPELQSLCQEFSVVPWKAYQPQHWRARLGFLNFTPRSLVDTFSGEMRRSIEQYLSKCEYDLVIASQLTAASYRPYFGDTRTLFEEVELGVFSGTVSQPISTKARIRHGLTWAKHRSYLERLLGRFDACTVASEQERQLLSQVAPGYRAVDVIPNCISLADYQDVESEISETETLIFTGSFRYSANYQAMSWFTKDIFPLIQAQVSNVRLIITGDHANLPLPESKNVMLTGFVDDVRPLIASSWISLAPLLVGGGTRLKILEAMALRTPVVATAKGAEGLDARDGQHLLIADSPQAFAEATIRLLREPGLRQQLAENAYQLVSEKYDWSSVMPRFLTLVEKVAFA
jgi:polysaccharide biosynthesis protein PslH